MTIQQASQPRPTQAEQPTPNVARAAGATLDQCAAFLRDLSDSDYTACCDRMMGASIGKHVRHALDHFTAAMRALEGETIDYDQRDRGTAVEQKRAEALRLADSLARTLSVLTEHDAARPVRVRVMLSGEGDEAELSSTLGRELAFAAHHAVHHYAMIRTIAAEFDVEPAADFGKAPSTISYERAAR